jgi:hypothetical protein
MEGLAARRSVSWIVGGMTLRQAPGIGAAATSAQKPGTIGYFATFGNLSAGPPNATAWDALKDIGLELVGIVILATLAGVSPAGANFAIGFLLLLWLLAIVSNPSKA